MLYLLYWELIENVTEQERLQFAQKITSLGKVPPEGVNIVRWDITPDLWGTTLFEAENPIDVFKTKDMWRTKAGFFKTVKTSPVMPVQEVVPQMAEFIKSLT